MLRLKLVEKCKMKRWLYPLLVLFVLPVVSGALCEETIPIRTNCTMVTPVLSCASYTYEVVNLSGSVVGSGNLSALYGSLYSFNFTLSAGDYLVKLCDGTTREVRVALEDGNSMILAIMLCLGLLTGIFGYMSVAYRDSSLQLLYFMATVWFLVAVMGVGVILARAYTEVPGVVSVMVAVFTVVGFIALFTTFYVLVQYTKMVVLYRAKKKEKEYDGR